MRVLIAAALAAMSVATPGFAQVADRSAGTQAFTNMCIAQAGANVTTPEPTCACGAGVVSARMDDRQFTLMTRFAPHLGNKPAMNAEVQRMVTEGYTPREIMAVGQMLIDLGPFVDARAACWNASAARPLARALGQHL